MSRKKTVEPFKESSPLVMEIVSIVNKVLQEREINIQEAEIRAIVRELMPDIDRLIANKMKQHFYEIGNFLVEKFKLEE